MILGIFIKAKPEEKRPEITSLADVVFLLLVFFVVITLIGTLSSRNGHNSSTGTSKEEAEKAPGLPVASAGSEKTDMGLTIRFVDIGSQQGFRAHLFDENIANEKELDDKIKNLQKQLPQSQDEIDFLRKNYGPFAQVDIALAGDITRLSNNFKDKIIQRAEPIRQYYQNQGREFNLFVRADERTYYGYIVDIFILSKINLDIDDVNFEVKIAQKGE